MSQTPAQTLPKIAGKGLLPVQPLLRLSKQAETAVTNCQLATDALDLLEGGGYLLEAARLLALTLPRREAVWWACMCAAHTEPPDLPEADRKSRQAAEVWVRQNSDENRLAAKKQSESTKLNTPEAWCALAVYFSGDSMLPEGQPVAPPPPYNAGKILAGAITLAAVRGDALKQKTRLQRFLESGRNVAAGGAGRLPHEG